MHGLARPLGHARGRGALDLHLRGHGRERRRTAILSFRVTVGVAFEEQQQVVRRTLAEVASRTVAGAVSNIGTRLGDAAPAPGMTIAGEQVSFGASGTGDGADGALGRGLSVGRLGPRLRDRCAGLRAPRGEPGRRTRTR